MCAVAAVGPDRREMDDVTMRALIYVESREAAMLESGDIIRSGQPVTAEIGEVIGGMRPMPPPGERVVFKSLGVAATDLAAAGLVWGRWRMEGSIT